MSERCEERQEEVEMCENCRVAEVSIIAVADGSVTARLSHVRTQGRARDGLLEPGGGHLLQCEVLSGEEGLTD